MDKRLIKHMFTIAFNNFEKQKLLEILSKDGSKEAQEFMNRVNSCCGFYSPDEDNATFRYYGSFKIYCVTVPNEDPNLPSGVKFFSENSC